MKLPSWLKKLFSISRTTFLPLDKSTSPESISAPTESKECHPPSATFNDLPQELLDRIIDYVAEIPLLYRALEACALTCHALYPRTVTLRFRHINLATQAAFTAFEGIVMGSLPHVIPHVESLSLRMPFREDSNWSGNIPVLERIIWLLPNLKYLHIQDCNWKTMISPSLSSALASHSYHTVRLTNVKFYVPAQLAALLAGSPELQRLAIDMGCVSQKLSPQKQTDGPDVEIDSLEINYQLTRDVLRLIKGEASVSLERLRKLKVCLRLYQDMDLITHLFDATAASLRVLVIHSPREIFPDHGTWNHPAPLTIPRLVHHLAIVLSAETSPGSIWVDIGLSYWLDVVKSGSSHLQSITIELPFFPDTDDFDLWRTLNDIEFPCLKRLLVVIYESEGRRHTYIEERLPKLKERGILYVEFKGQWVMYEYDSRGQYIEDPHLTFERAPGGGL